MDACIKLSFGHCPFRGQNLLLVFGGRDSNDAILSVEICDTKYMIYGICSETLQSFPLCNFLECVDILYSVIKMIQQELITFISVYLLKLYMLFSWRI